jgi:lipoprotein-anchoring transpeptidase ErfK/SrfK
MRTVLAVAVFFCLGIVGQARADTSIEVRFGEKIPHLYLLQDGEVKATYPVAIARSSVKLNIPVVGEATRVFIHAPWYPTQRSREAYAAQHRGEALPAMVPYGDPRNAMGIGKIMLAFPPGWTTKPLRIHGTTEPNSIGKRVSSGCVRLHNADFVDLAHRLGEVKLPVKVHFKQ